MKSVQLVFKKVGNHWYLNIPHDKPNDLILHPVFERCLDVLNTDNTGIVSNVYLDECYNLDSNFLIQFTDQDLLKYFTTDKSFLMDLYIDNHCYKISSELYSLLEATYQLDLHQVLYKITIF